MERLTDLPTTPDGLPIGKNGLPKQFKDEKGLSLSGGEVVKAMHVGRTLEAISRKPACNTLEDATALPPISIEIHDALTNFSLQPRRRDPLASFDINPRKRNK